MIGNMIYLLVKMEARKYKNDSIITRVRPIKKLCIIEKTDFSRFIEIINIYSKELCGILNLILINDASLFSSNTVEFIKSHDPDIIINYSLCDNEKLMKEFKILVLKGGSEDFRLEDISFPIDSLSNELDPYRALRKKIDKIFANLDESPTIEKIFLYLNFGLINEELARRLENTIFKGAEIIPADSMDISSEQILNHESNFLYQTLNLYWPDTYTSIFEIDHNPNRYFDVELPTLILGGSTNIDAMVYFWNERASYPYCKIAWLPLELLDDCRDMINDFKNYCLFSDERQFDISARVYEANPLIKEINCSKYYFSSRSNEWRLLEHLENITIIDNKFRIRHPIEKMFSKEGLNGDLVMEVSGLEELFLPKSLALGELFRETSNRHNIYNFSRINRQRLVYTFDSFEPYANLPYVDEIKIPDSRTIFRTIFKEDKLDLVETKNASLANQVVNLIGGPHHLNIFSEEDIYEFLTKLAPKRIKRIIDEIARKLGAEIPEDKIEKILKETIGSIQTIDSITLVEAKDFSGILGRPIRDKGAYHSKIQKLYEENLLLRGKKFTCKHCMSTLWFPLDSLENEVKCYCCGNTIAIPIFSGKDILNDSFKLNELLSNAIDQGVLPLMLTANFIFNQKILGIRFIFDSEILSNGTNIAEIDIIFTLAHKIGLAEVKTNSGFPRDQIDRYVKASQLVNADLLLFSTLKDKNSQEISDLIDYLKSLDLEIPAFILTREVLFRKEIPDISPYFHRDSSNEGFRKGPILIDG
jgi:hypothetical protein